MWIMRRCLGLQEVHLPRTRRQSHLALGVEQVTFQLLNHGIDFSGLTPSKVGFDMFEVPITM